MATVLDTVSTAESATTALAEFVESNSSLCVITGAGISLPSGIPTYRDNKGIWKSRTPIQHADFMASPKARQRYWTRSFFGWPAMGKASPNGAHRALATLESLGHVHNLVTQNVDRLHQRAGHQQVVDLHGRLDQVVCMQCRTLTPRAEIQDWLVTNNTHLHGQSTRLAPDGDADAADELIAMTQSPSCNSCGGILKPNVVFFGDSVPKDIVDNVMQALQNASGLLVVGSSLMVYSSFRFCRAAHARGLSIACINEGTTRADDIIDLKLETDCVGLLTDLIRRLAPPKTAVYS